MEYDALRALLERLDDPVYAEYPANWAPWSQQVAEAHFMILVKTLATRLGCLMSDREPSHCPRDPDYDRSRERALFYETNSGCQLPRPDPSPAFTLDRSRCQRRLSYPPAYQ